MKIRMMAEQPNKAEFIDHLIQKYHFSVEDRENLQSVYEKVRSYMVPCAVYRINSRMRGIPLIDDGQAALVAMTLGEGIDRLQEYYEREHALSESYMVECIANEMLLLMYAEFNRSYPRFHRRYVRRYVFVGDEIPLSSMRALLGEVYGMSDSQENQITANEYGVLLPSKSVVFFALLSEKPDQSCQGICMNCNNVSCENRMQEQRQIRTDRKHAEKTESADPSQQLTYGYQRIFGKSEK